MSAEPLDEPRLALEPQPAPVDPRRRQFELDALRGLAVLGILAVNAESFGWPLWSMFAPPTIAYAPADHLGEWVVETFFQDRFRTLFSLLFGVSIFLVGGENADAARGRLLRRRLLWLLALGLIHGALVWWGDILLHYAYCGLIAAHFRSWPASKLLWVGGGVTAAWAVITLGSPLLTMSMGGTSDAQAQSMIQMAGYTARFSLETIEAVRSGWPGAMLENLKAWGLMQLFSLFLIPITVPLMLLGLGLYKAGYFTRAPASLHLIFVAVGAAVLAPLGWLAWTDGAESQMDPAAQWTQAVGGLDVLVTLGYASLLILLTRWGLKAIIGVLAPVGRMAFTNYLTQSLVMVALFTAPFGPRLYGALGPAALWGIVAAIWVAQLVVSPLWLKVFRYGPFEWVWRCLTYGRALPIRAPR